jgi:hypothetical protein
MTRVIDANLDCECHFARRDTQLPPKILERISGVASLLRVFQTEVLLTPAPIDGDRIPAIEGIQEPKFISGEVPKDFYQVLAWGHTKYTHSSNRKTVRADSIRETVWQTKSGSSKASEQANDKLKCFDLQARQDILLPKAQLIQSLDEFEALDRPEKWILKPRFGVAGRGRILGQNSVNIETLMRIKAALKQHEKLVFEPWVNRIQDFGVTGFVDKQGVYAVQVHQLQVDNNGGFKGIITHPTEIDATTHATLQAQFAIAGNHLIQLGYRGPFGIDAFSYRDQNGEKQLHPLNEINARLTFGHLARAYSELFERPLTLSFGASPPQNAIPLLLPSRKQASAAWLSF